MLRLINSKAFTGWPIGFPVPEGYSTQHSLRWKLTTINYYYYSFYSPPPPPSSITPSGRLRKVLSHTKPVCEAKNVENPCFKLLIIKIINQNNIKYGSKWINTWVSIGRRRKKGRGLYWPSAVLVSLSGASWRWNITATSCSLTRLSCSEHE